MITSVQIILTQYLPTIIFTRYIKGINQITAHIKLSPSELAGDEQTKTEKDEQRVRTPTELTFD